MPLDTTDTEKATLIELLTATIERDQLPAVAVPQDAPQTIPG
jgi:hypothetical protein